MWTDKPTMQRQGHRKRVSFQVIDNPRPLQIIGRKDGILFGLIGIVNSVNVDTATGQRLCICHWIWHWMPSWRIRIKNRQNSSTSHLRTWSYSSSYSWSSKHEFDNLVWCGIISPVTEPTPWREEKEPRVNLHWPISTSRVCENIIQWTVLMIL